MARKKFEAAHIIGHLRTIEIFLGKGKTTAEACREVGITEQTYLLAQRILRHASIPSQASQSCCSQESPKLCSSHRRAATHKALRGRKF